MAISDDDLVAIAARLAALGLDPVTHMKVSAAVVGALAEARTLSSGPPKRAAPASSPIGAVRAARSPRRARKAGVRNLTVDTKRTGSNGKARKAAVRNFTTEKRAAAAAEQRRAKMRQYAAARRAKLKAAKTNGAGAPTLETKSSGPLQRAIHALQKQLAAGPKPLSEVESLLEARGLSLHFERARAELGCELRRLGDGKGVCLVLPSPPGLKRERPHEAGSAGLA